MCGKASWDGVCAFNSGFFYDWGGLAEDARASWGKGGSMVCERKERTNATMSLLGAGRRERME